MASTPTSGSRGKRFDTYWFRATDLRSVYSSMYIQEVDRGWKWMRARKCECLLEARMDFGGARKREGGLFVKTNWGGGGTGFGKNGRFPARLRHVLGHWSSPERMPAFCTRTAAPVQPSAVRSDRCARIRSHFLSSACSATGIYAAGSLTVGAKEEVFFWSQRAELKADWCIELRASRHRARGARERMDR